MELKFCNVTWLGFLLLCCGLLTGSVILLRRSHVRLSCWCVSVTRYIVCGDVADVVFDGSVLENADRNTPMRRSQDSSATALGREAVVTCCRAWLFLFVACAHSVVENAYRNITVCRSQVSSPAAFGREVVAIVCTVWHLFVSAGFMNVGCGHRRDSIRRL